MDIRLTTDTSQLDRWASLMPKRLPQGEAYAINHTVDRVRTEKLFPHIRSRFLIRGAARDAFFFGAPGAPGGAAGKFPRSARATAQRLWAEFGTSAMETRRWGGKGGPILLGGFETGEMRRPMSGGKSIAVPAIGRPARPSIAGPVPPAFAIANLHLQAHYRGAKIVRRTRGGHVRGMGIYGSDGRPGLGGVQGMQFKGLQRTFLLPHTERAPLGGIFQRYQRGRDGIRILYPFIAPFRLDTRLHYAATVQREAPLIFRQEMDAALDWAVNVENERAARRLLSSAG